MKSKAFYDLRFGSGLTRSRPKRILRSVAPKYTPDEQIYEEAFLETDPENFAIRSFGCRNFSGHPPEVTQEIYSFDGEPSAASIKKWLAEGKSEARHLLANRGEEFAVEPLHFYAMVVKKYDIATMEEVKPPGPARRLPKKAPGQAGPSKEGEKKKEDEDDESLVWVSSEKTDHCAIGDVISEQDVKVTLGERGRDRAHLELRVLCAPCRGGRCEGGAEGDLACPLD